MSIQTINRNKNPIVIIDDDEEDISIIMEAAFSLKIDNEILTFNDAKSALVYFAEDNPPPFFILCDINMPIMDGFKLRQHIDIGNFSALRATPFIFLTTIDQMDFVNKAFVHNIQGYFTKPKSYRGFVDLFGAIISYWNISVLPNPFISIEERLNA